jgi:hypothetical protein
MPVIRIALWIALLVGAMLLPFLPGGYDPLATSLSTSATGASFVGLLLVPVGMVWLASARGYAAARAALAVAALVTVGAALPGAATGSMTAGTVVLVACATYVVSLWRRVTAARTEGATLPLSVPVALIVIPIAAVATRMAVLESTAEKSRARTIANAAEIIADVERFRERTGAYPVALNSLWPDYKPGSIGVERYRYEPSGEAYNLYFEHPSTDIAAREIVMYNPRGEQDFSSHVVDLLRLSPGEIRRQRGYFRSEELPQRGWKRFLFD